MAEHSNISWTDATFNPWMGCTHVHEGCTNCYAEAFAKRYNKAKWGKHGTRVLTTPGYWSQAIKWNDQAEKAGVKKRVFCASLADVFETWDGPMLNHKGQRLAIYAPNGHMLGCAPEIEEPPPNCSFATMADLHILLFKLIDRTPWLTWQLLTKRPENILKVWPMRETESMPYRDNVWLLTSVSNQKTADKMIPELLKARHLVPVYGVSAEPLLGPVDFRLVPGFNLAGAAGKEMIKNFWVIVGGESGAGRRPCEIEWMQAIAERCRSASVPLFVKQDAAALPGQQGRIPNDLWAMKEFPRG